MVASPPDGEPEPPSGVDPVRAREEFDRLYERIAPALYTWADVRIRADLRSWLDPQDLVQEVWCRAWRRHGEFDPSSASFRYWVFRIAKNVLLEGLRRLRDPAFRSADAGSTTRVFALANLPDSATGVTRRVARDEGLRLFADWLRGLDDEDQRLILHCGLEGMSHSEASERLRLSPDAVAKRWQRLRGRLEEQRVPREIYASVER